MTGTRQSASNKKKYCCTFCYTVCSRPRHFSGNFFNAQCRNSEVCGVREKTVEDCEAKDKKNPGAYVIIRYRHDEKITHYADMKLKY